MNVSEGGSGRRGRGGVVRVLEEKDGRSVARVSNPLLLPLAFIDVLLTALVCALNYYLRYDPSLREDCSLVNWEGLLLPCSGLANHTLPLPSGVSFTLPESIFFTCAIVVPCLMVILVEAARSQFPGRKVKKVKSVCLTFPLWARRIPRFIYAFLLGGGLTGVLVAVTKLLVPCPRPYLLAVCDPNPDPEAGPMCSSDLTWSPEEVCQGDTVQVHEALRAFPSYHAALACYSGVWTCIYFSSMAKLPGVYSSRLVLVGGVLVMTLIGSTHGLLTYQSSSTDVIAGGIIGTIAAFYVVYGVLNGFRERKWRMRVVGGGGQPDHPNLLPTLPLGGSPDVIQQLRNKCQAGQLDDNHHDSHDDDDESDDDDDFMLSSLAFSSDSFPIIPRATTISRGGGGQAAASLPPAQAVNPIVSDRLSVPPPRPNPMPPLPPPPPPPPPPSGPPPSYSRPDPSMWTTAASAPYNIPRQRYSAPGPTPRAPAYDAASQTLPHRGVLLAYHHHDSDTLPRARKEATSYF